MFTNYRYSWWNIVFRSHNGVEENKSHVTLMQYSSKLRITHARFSKSKSLIPVSFISRIIYKLLTFPGPCVSAEMYLPVHIFHIHIYGVELELNWRQLTI